MPSLMAKEIHPDKAEVFKLGFKKRLADPDIESVRESLVKLANDIDRIADKTRWPEWSRNQAEAMREYANQIKEPPP